MKQGQFSLKLGKNKQLIAGFFLTLLGIYLMRSLGLSLYSLLGSSEDNNELGSITDVSLSPQASSISQGFLPKAISTLSTVAGQTALNFLKQAGKSTNHSSSSPQLAINITKRLLMLKRMLSNQSGWTLPIPNLQTLQPSNNPLQARITFTPTVFIQDGNPGFPNEACYPSLPIVSTTIVEGIPKNIFNLTYCCGDEVRGEIAFNLTLNKVAMHTRITNTIDLYEGTDCNTIDIDTSKNTVYTIPFQSNNTHSNVTEAVLDGSLPNSDDIVRLSYTLFQNIIPQLVSANFTFLGRQVLLIITDQLLSVIDDQSISTINISDTRDCYFSRNPFTTAQIANGLVNLIRTGPNPAFSLIAQDPFGEYSKKSNITVATNNNPPEYVGSNMPVVIQSNPTLINLLNLFQDIDGDPLQFSPSNTFPSGISLVNMTSLLIQISQIANFSIGLNVSDSPLYPQDRRTITHMLSLDVRVLDSNQPSPKPSTDDLPLPIVISSGAGALALAIMVYCLCSRCRKNHHEARNPHPELKASGGSIELMTKQNHEALEGILSAIKNNGALLRMLVHDIDRQTNTSTDDRDDRDMKYVGVCADMDPKDGTLLDEVSERESKTREVTENHLRQLLQAVDEIKEKLNEKKNEATTSQTPTIPAYIKSCFPYLAMTCLSKISANKTNQLLVHKFHNELLPLLNSVLGERKPSIFISYAWAIDPQEETWNDLFVRTFAQHLEHIGFEVKIDFENSQATGSEEKLMNFMHDGINHSDFVVLILSKDYKTKIDISRQAIADKRQDEIKFCYHEYQAIAAKKKSSDGDDADFLIPILLDGDRYSSIPEPDSNSNDGFNLRKTLYLDLRYQPDPGHTQIEVAGGITRCVTYSYLLKFITKVAAKKNLLKPLESKESNSLRFTPEELYKTIKDTYFSEIIQMYQPDTNDTFNDDTSIFEIKEAKVGSHLQTIPLTDGGHNLFQAIAAATDSKLDDKTLREHAADYIEKHSDAFRDFITMIKVQEYANMVRNLNQYGGHLEIIALMQCLNRPIYIINSNNNGIANLYDGSEIPGEAIFILENNQSYAPLQKSSGVADSIIIEELKPDLHSPTLSHPRMSAVRHDLIPTSSANIFATPPTIKDHSSNSETDSPKNALS